MENCDLGYVKSECERLAEQIAHWGKVKQDESGSEPERNCQKGAQ
jgi:hypothetical protein